MPHSKPTDLPRWGADSGDVPGANLLEPTSGQKDTGWTNGQKPVPSNYWNWIWWTTYRWVQYLNDLTDQALTWTGAHIFSTSGGGHAPITASNTSASGVVNAISADSTNGPAIVASSNAGNHEAINAAGHGTQAGVKGIGGATGPGLEGLGGATSGAGVKGTGGPASAGVTGFGTGAGVGVAGTGGATNATGVTGTGGGGTATGVEGTGVGNGDGVVGLGSGLGAGINGLGGASGAGVHAAGNANRGALNLDPQATPSAPANGDIWVDTDNTLKVRINGATKTVTVT